MKKENNESAEQIYDNLDFSIFLPREEAIAQISILIDDYRKRIKQEEEELSRQIEAERQRQKNITESGLAGLMARNMGGLNTVRGFAKPMFKELSPKIPSALHISGELTKEREAIDAVIRNARHQMRLISNFLDTINGNPESSPQIAYSLLVISALFFIGVIYPLSFLPQPINANIELSLSAFFPLLLSVRGILLLSISVLFISAIAMFYFMNMRMKYSNDQIIELKNFTELGLYSKYFTIMESNQNIRHNKEEG